MTTSFEFRVSSFKFQVGERGVYKKQDTRNKIHVMEKGDEAREGFHKGTPCYRGIDARGSKGRQGSVLDYAGEGRMVEGEKTAQVLCTLPLEREAKMPAKQRTAKMMKAILMLVIRAG
jgi:hypothetical protein